MTKDNDLYYTIMRFFNLADDWQDVIFLSTPKEKALPIQQIQNSLIFGFEKRHFITLTEIYYAHTIISIHPVLLFPDFCIGYGHRLSLF
jgi:hypothetical protein